MKKATTRVAAARAAAALLTFAFATGLAAVAHAQDRLKTMPGYEEYQRMAALRSTLGMGGRGGIGGGSISWSADSKSVDFDNAGKRARFDVASQKVVDATDAGMQQTGGRGRGGFGNQPARGRQFEFAVAPAGNHRAIYRDRNVWVADSTGANAVQITKDGSVATRIKYGTASWVYGEELSQRTAMWWSPDGKKLAYYRFDESKVPDFYLATNLTAIQDTLDVEAYPKPGVPNPVVDLFIYDVDSKKTTRVDVRDGKPFENATIGYYVFRVDWSPVGSELTFLRTNRRQNTMEMAACNPESGACRIVIHEENPTGWIDDDPAPSVTWLKDRNRFLWESDRSGFKNYYLYDFKAAKLIAPVTQLPAEVVSIVRIDEPAGVMYYTGRDGDNYMKVQLHRVGLDGRNDMRLTDPAFTHTVTLSPDAKYFVDVAETHDQAPVTRLADAAGKVVAELAKTDLTKFNEIGLKKVEMYTYKTSDGQATLHGIIHYPSNFDPSKKYPVLVSVYGGPAVANSTTERFQVPSATAEYGFIVLNVEARTNPGMGRKYLDAVYLKLGQTEQDDMADAVKALWNRPYIDKNRVGVYGTSYGGYTSVMEILRHPEVFAAASSSSPPTDWRNYDTIYTERYMWIPQENKEGYDKGSALSYVGDLRGRLMLYFGTADNNVHPSNMMQLIQGLQRAGKSFDVQVGPDQGHSGLNPQRMMEFFIENLVLNGAGPKA
ncbi:MAG: peptidase dipeptidylpeptidase domain protein [Gemmatimonadetes bacterium]|nr:peptidase dipeptidylpeptidase domain protein [Gemmatimonadota bacterium]